jgi:ribonuclease HI
MNTYYAVARGRVPGVYKTWSETLKHVDGYKGARYKKFSNFSDAQNFVEGRQVLRQSKLSEFFNVASGAPGPPSGPPGGPKGPLVVFTDGACTKNGTSKARASSATVWPSYPELDGGFVLSNDQVHSNNRGEYHAVIRAFEQADTIDPECIQTLVVYTDSQLLIKSLTMWLFGWKRNNWKKSNGEPVANLDLVQKLDEYIQKRKAIFRHVKAHTGGQDFESLNNHKVDQIATLLLRVKI